MSLPVLYEQKNDGLPVPTAVGPAFQQSTEDEFTVRYLWALLRRRKLAFFLTLANCVLLALLWTSAMPKVYSAFADVVLITKSTDVVPNSDVRLEDRPTRSEEVETQIQLIVSREMAGQVLDTTGVLKDPSFRADVIEPRSVVDNLMATIGIDRKPNATLNSMPASVLRERAITYLVRGLNVVRTGNSYNLRITTKDTDPARAAQLTNAYARLFTTDDSRERANANRTAAKVLESKLNELREQANQNFAAVQAYRVKNQLLSSAATGLTEQELSTYNQQIGAARAEAARDAAELSAARSQLNRGGAEGVGEGAGSPLMATLRSQRAQLVIKERELSQRYFDNNPDLDTVRRQIRDIDRQISQETGRSVLSLEAKAQASAQRLSSLLQSRTGTRAQLSTDNSALVSLSDLENRAQASQALYQSYLQRYNSVVAGSGTEQPSARLISSANVPLLPVSPNLLLNVALGVSVGILLGAMVSIVSELSYRGLTTLEDVEKRIGLKAFGFLPNFRTVEPHGSSPLDTVLEYPDGAFSEAVRNLIVSLKQSSTNVKVIAITSAIPGEGKTTVAACVGRSLALANENVLVIDCDVVRGQLSKQFGLSNGDQGLYEALYDADGVICQYQESGSPMRILPITKPFGKGERLTEKGRLHRVIARLRGDFDIIILDCPPILPIAEAREIAALADKVVFVVPWRQTLDKVVLAAIRQLPSSVLPNLGILLNNVDMKKQEQFGGSDAASLYGHYKSYYS